MKIFEFVKQMSVLNVCYFSTPQQINIKLLQTEYYEYTNVGYEFINKYPSYTGYYNIDEYTNLSEQMKNDIGIYTKKQEIVRERLIRNCQSYCKNYPDEKLCTNRFLEEYTKYPYRLHQNMNTIIEDLD